MGLAGFLTQMAMQVLPERLMLKTQSLATAWWEARAIRSIGRPRLSCRTSISMGRKVACSWLHLMAASLALQRLQKDNCESG
jgi:hypothetical protein